MLKLIFFVAFFYPLLSFGEFHCQDDIKISWKSKPEINEVPTTTNISPSSEATPSQTSPEVKSEFYTQIYARGISEEEARTNLEKASATAKDKALRSCKNQHENLSGCSATKYSAMASIINNLSFSARKEIEKAISIDCQKNHGECISAEGTEVKCKEIVKGEPTPVDGGEAKTENKAEKEKDVKGKK